MSTKAGGPTLVDSKSQWGSLRPDAPVAFSPLTEDALAGECCRRIAVQIEQLAGKREQKGGFVIGITGVDLGAGKSTTALNLAMTLGRRGEVRVLLVEADLWRPGLSSMLQIDPGIPGLANILELKVPLHKTIVSLYGVGIDVIRAGKPEGQDVGDLIATQKLQSLFHALRSDYQYIVVDMPSVLLAGGRAAVAATDGAVVVVRARQTWKKWIAQGLSVIGPEKTLGIVVNDARLKQHGYGTYYGGYGQGSDTPYWRSTEEESEGRARRLVAWLRRHRLWLAGAAAAVAVALVVSLGGEDVAPTIPSTPALEPPPAAAGEPSGAAQEAPVIDEPSPAAGSVERADAPESALPAYVTRRINLRVGPGTDYESIELLPVETALAVVSRQGDWLQVQVDDLAGWVWAGGTSLAETTPGPDPTTLPSGEGVFPNEDPGSGTRGTAAQSATATVGLNLRLGPGTDQAKAGSLGAGTVLEIVGRQGDWLEVRAQGLTGWVWIGGTSLAAAPAAIGERSQ